MTLLRRPAWRETDRTLAFGDGRLVQPVGETIRSFVVAEPEGVRLVTGLDVRRGGRMTASNLYYSSPWSDVANYERVDDDGTECVLLNFHREATKRTGVMLISVEQNLDAWMAALPTVGLSPA